MIFLKVMNLILVLVVAVVARPESKIRQCETPRDAHCVLGVTDGAGEVFVEEVEDFAHDVVFLRLRDVSCGGVREAVGFFDVVGGPGA